MSMPCGARTEFIFSSWLFLKAEFPLAELHSFLPPAQLFFRSELFFSLSLWIFGKHTVLQQNKPMKVKTSSLPVCKHFLEQYAQL